MQFVTNGPDIPERLLQAHEDGQVVFFCGAGISYPAGLPGFAGLVDRVYANLVGQPNPIQKAAIKSGQFDTAIGLLEAEIVGGRKTVRKALAKILTPATPIAPAATATHEALLTLGKNRKGRTRLVTTNFDRLFEEVIASRALNIECFQPPLPVPKRRWDGLMYLHGLLSAEPSESELDRLVVSSGDFGLAYLTERWAARFVSELFRGYSVCFVGYSLNDPMLRYMMDALAADRLLGESSPEMFAFGSFSEGEEETRENEWRARNVTPILYRKYCRHAYLHRTLRAWAKTYRDGVGGKEYIAAQYAMDRPSTSTQQDNFVARMRWALSDPSGLPAKRFAEFDPAPSLDWLKPLSEEAYGHADLARFGVPHKATVDDKLAFSLINRPSPYPLAPWMCLVDNGARGRRWDTVMPHLAHWLTRHLDDPALLLWLAERGGQLHEDMAEEIERRLNELYELERDGKTAELARIRKNAPRAIPGAPMRTLWRFMLTGHVKPKWHNLPFHRWRKRFKRYGLTSSLRLELRKMLTPRIALSKPLPWPVTKGETGEPERIEDLVNWEIVLSTDYVHSSLRHLSNNERWTDALPELLSDFSALLRDALDLRRELDGINDKSDRSYFQQPSISEHEQNRKFRDWTALIDLTRDAWLATARQSPARAAFMTESWLNTPYPLFKRLAFFAAARDRIIPLRRALDWLLADECWWLWSAETKREALRLLVSLAPRLDAAMLRELEQAVLAGPPREMYPDDIEPERWNLIVDRDIWLRLAKIAEAGTALSEDGEKKKEQIQAKYPESQWQLAADQRDEFSCWMHVGSVGELRNVTSPRRRELIEWLRQNPDTDPDTDPWQQDDWPQRCRDHFATSACALYALTREDLWPKDRWREALQVWSEGKHRKRSWRYMAPVVANVPDAVLQPLAYHVSYWLRAIAETFKDQEAHEAHFFALVERILALDIEDGVDHDIENDVDHGDLILTAKGHTVGHITQALLNWWYRGSLKDGQGLPEELKARFTGFCDTKIDKFRHARVLLARHIIALFRVDRNWTTQQLLPLFDWQVPREARAAWQGFLCSSRLYRPLIEALKPAFLDTAGHYEKLGEFQRQYPALLVSAALDLGDTFTKTELKNATCSLPANGLHDAAQALVDALESAGDQRANYWSNRVAPYLREIWPQTRDRVSPEISESFARLCIEAQDKFPEALEQLHDWLQPVEYPDFLVARLHKAGLCGEFPEEALEFLSRVVGEQTQFLPDDLGDCLKAIESASPELNADQRFKRLSNYLRPCSASN